MTWSALSPLFNASGFGSRGHGPDQPCSFLLSFADLTAANAQARASRHCDAVPGAHIFGRNDGI